jgi:hypothetical protein
VGRGEAALSVYKTLRAYWICPTNRFLHADGKL